MAAPSVTTDAASVIRPTRATLNGTITATGGANVTGWGFRINIAESDSGAWDINVASAISSPQSVSLITRGLTEGRTYYFKFYAANADGTTWGSWASFDTLHRGAYRIASVILYHGAGTLTYTENDSSKLADYSLAWDENIGITGRVWIENQDPTSTVNLLNSSCAVWSSGTGALALGDKVVFKFYQLYGASLDTLVTGYVNALVPEESGLLRIEFSCGLKALENITNWGRPIYSSFRDHKVFDLAYASGIRYMDGVTDNDILTPLKHCAVALTDSRLDLYNATGKDYYSLDQADEFVAQHFIAPGNALVGLKVSYKTDTYAESGETAKIRIEIRPAKEDGLQSTQVVAYIEEEVGANDAETELELDFCASGEPTWLEPGMMYYVVVKGTITPDDPGGYIGIYYNNAVDTFAYGSFRYYSDSSYGWAAGILRLIIDTTNYEELDHEEYRVDETNNRIDILATDLEESPAEATPYYTVYRGMASYYYGTVTAETVVNALIERSGIFDASVSTSLDRTFSLYDGNGRKLADCIREILDIVEATGATWAGYQKVMAHYDNSTVPTIKVGKRIKVGDDPYQIFSHPDDTSNDWEHVIVGHPQMKKTVKMKYAEVRVVGSGPDGTPIVATRSDKTMTGSMAVAMLGQAEVLEVHDNTLSAYADVVARAIAELDAVNRDQWEGSISLDGHHLLWDIDSSSDTFGSGRIVTLNWSPLGISDVDLKVRSVVLTPMGTEIYVTNTDLVKQNKNLKAQKDSRDAIVIHSSLEEDVVYLRTTVLETIAGDTLYMQLNDSGDAALGEQERVLCVLTTNSTYNSRTYMAIFKRYNAHGTVDHVKLYDAITAGSLAKSQDLYRTVSSVAIDERVDKHRGTTLIVEITGKGS